MAVPSSSKSFFFKLHTGTLEVKTWMQERGLYVPWGTHCFLCRKPETIEHVFLDCWEGVFFWDILQRTIKKDLPLDAYGIRFLPVHEEDDGAPYDAVMLLGLYSIWKKYMAVRHADINTLPIREYFRQMISNFVEDCKIMDPVPEWLGKLEPLMHIKEL
uniref:Reverse transcriptase zinc-binding domain-containing protein n=1 Tax=Rhipicephalus pulchellus TaxID=72859 RepID=L7M273_RHIPC